MYTISAVTGINVYAQAVLQADVRKTGKSRLLFNTSVACRYGASFAVPMCVCAYALVGGLKA